MPTVVHFVGAAKQNDMNSWGVVVNSEWTAVEHNEEGNNTVRPGKTVSFQH